MIEILVVVLVAGLAVVASLYFRRRGYSPNQRIILSAIAVALLAWNFRSQIANNPAQGLLVGIAALVLIFGAWLVGKSR